MFESQIGAFRGTTLIHKEGTIGGARSVFVNSKGLKDELSYFPIGGSIQNPFKGAAKFFAGDLFEFRTNDKGVAPKIYLLKTYLVESASGTTLNLVKDGYKHTPFVGDKIGVAPEEIGGEMTAVTITSVKEGKVGNVKVWVCTTNTALTTKKGDVLVEADVDDTMLVKNIQGVADSDGDLVYAPATGDDEFDGARYHYVPARGGEMFIHKMSPIPACVLKLNKSNVNGWFKVQS